jgi:hypothetical protein
MSRTTKTPAWSDDGGATVYIVGLTLALFACAALVFAAGYEWISAGSGVLELYLRTVLFAALGLLVAHPKSVSAGATLQRSQGPPDV